MPSSDRDILVRHVPKDLHTAIRTRAVQEDRSMSEVLIDAARLYLKKGLVGAAKRLREE